MMYIYIYTYISTIFIEILYAYIYIRLFVFFFFVRAWLIYFYSFPYYIVHRFVPVHAKPQHIDDDPPATVLCCVNEARLRQALQHHPETRKRFFKAVFPNLFKLNVPFEQLKLPRHPNPVIFFFFEKEKLIFVISHSSKATKKQNVFYAV